MKWLLFHSEVVFTLFFWYEVQFVIRCWLRQFWGIWHFNILYLFLFRKDWLILHQTKWSLTNKIFDEQMCTLGKHMSLTVSIKFINGLNGKIWVFTPLEHFWLCITLLTYILKRYNHYFRTNIFAIKVLFFYIQYSPHFKNSDQAQ